MFYERNGEKISEKRLNSYWYHQIVKKNTHPGCYFHKICDVAERKYKFENTATESYPDFYINYMTLSLV